MLEGNEKLTCTDGTVFTVKKTNSYHLWTHPDRKFSVNEGREPDGEYDMIPALRLEWNVLNYVEGPPLLIQALVDDAVKGGAKLETL